ncbi:MAG: hypothetical protein WEB78_07155 [Ilumatobacteraceae bacterium]
MRTRLIRLIASWILVGIGVPLLVRSQLGASPFDVLNTGVSEQTGWSFGTCFIVNSLLLFAAGRLLGARLGPACILGTIAIGPIIDLTLSFVPETELLALRIPYLILGIPVIGLAICLVVSTELGPGPTEVVMLGLVHRGVGIVPARWISDGLPVLVGTALGGAIGIGTALFVITMGPIVKFGLRRLRFEPSGHALEAAAAGF